MMAWPPKIGMFGRGSSRIVEPPKPGCQPQVTYPTLSAPPVPEPSPSPSLSLKMDNIQKAAKRAFLQRASLRMLDKLPDMSRSPSMMVDKALEIYEKIEEALEEKE